ncbi:MAG: cysteine--tRNA ligase [Rhizobiaceae bacterium]|nr:cysteine--tRNA ligase [Rhizobiaceae bacterium]
MTDKTELKLYNTLTRTKEAFEPIDADNVRMYVCGPTVYDFAHIGNARPVIVFDVLNRLLRHLYGDNHVTYVRNITDVDDKINARALQDFPNLPLNEAIRNVTEKTANQYHEDIKSLGCAEPDFEPRATEHIDGMIVMIQVLIDKGHAYVVSGNNGLEVLFDVKKMPAYGKLSNRKLDEQLAGARVAVESHKRSPGDFVLWKQSSDNEPGWDANFTDGGETKSIRGRPGWHIECSVMSEHHLGKIFDIHGGGLDLIFPHHENEIAQSCCAHDTDKMASLWMHNGYLQVEGKKMSKSDGNFITIYDLLHTDKFGGRQWPGEVLRLAMLKTHYREPIDFSVKRLEEAEVNLNKLYRVLKDSGKNLNLPNEATTPNDEHIKYLLDDLNTSEEFGALFTAMFGASSEELSKLLGVAEIMGLLQQSPEDWFRGDVDVDVDAEIAKRLVFFKENNWAEADKIRDELLDQGIQLMDSKDSETGERVTTWEAKR